MYVKSLVFDSWRICYGFWILANSKEGMAVLRMEYDRNVWKKSFVDKIQEYMAGYGA